VRLAFEPDRLYRWSLLAGALLVLLLLLLATRPARDRATAGPGSRRTTVFDVLVLAGAVALIAGPFGLLLCVPAVLAGRFRSERVSTVVGVGCVAAAGGLLVLHPWGSPGYVGRDAVVQALCATGLVVVWSTLVRGRGTSTGAALRQRMTGRSSQR
jgi:arabinofuranan 3-O-arabinosyltransferase